MDVRRAFLLFGIYLVAASVLAAADVQILSWDSKIVVEKTVKSWEAGHEGSIYGWRWPFPLWSMQATLEPVSC